MAELAVLRRLQRMGEEIGEDQLDKFAGLRAALDSAFARLGKVGSHAA